MKRLKKWNGRAGQCIPNSHGWNNGSVYLCAYSMADARRLIVELGGCDPGATELRDYFSSCWGNPMDGVPTERGMWYSSGRDKPIKIEAQEEINND